MIYQWDDHMKKDEMGCACGINKEKKKCKYTFNLRNRSCHGGEN
jgi:hypothetical protein